MSDSAERLARLSPERRAWVLARLAESELPPVPFEQPLRLTDAQLGIVLTQALAPTEPWFTVGDVLVIEGPLDVTALEGAFRALIERHDALRLSITEGRMQVLHPHVRFELPVHRADDREQAISAARAAAATALPIAAAPLMRAELWQAGPGLHVLALLIHHIISDGLSLAILLRDLSGLYAGQPLPPVGTGFVRWAASLTDPRGEPARAQSRRWWRQTLDATPYVPLPTRRPRVEPVSHRTLASRFTLGLPSSRVDEIAREARTSPFVVLTATLAEALSTYAGGAPVRVGTVSANRDGGTAESIGLFCNTVVIPCGSTDLRAVHQAVTRALAERWVLYESMFLAWNGEHPTLLESNALLLLEDLGLAEVRLGEARARWLADHAAPPNPSMGDLTVDLGRDRGEYAGRVRYHADLFDAEDIERMMALWRACLAAAT